MMISIIIDNGASAFFESSDATGALSAPARGTPGGQRDLPPPDGQQMGYTN